VKRFVLDASVSLAWFVDDPVPDLAVRVKHALGSGSIALVPALWHLEMANGLALAERRGKLPPSTIDRSLSSVEVLLGSAVETSTATILVRQAHATARAFGLTAYDAVYLDTAQREHLPLATLDGDLKRAATSARVVLVH
jgi:predicted nucleic acid-binding protein